MTRVFLSPVAPEEVECLINSLQDGKAAGPYSIPVKLLKTISHQISMPFCVIVYDCSLSEIFPNKLKIAKVITLYKKDSRDNPTNYHPISLLSVFSKLIEKNMYKRPYSFHDSCSILHPLQFDFRKKHSTLHALIFVILYYTYRAYKKRIEIIYNDKREMFIKSKNKNPHDLPVPPCK